ncbi:MAG: TolC family protein [Cyclobacteriaceae bacterium]|jgi:outer membrane protein|nr:TolC family protein [Cyclobacteriaceae bacterium]
MNKFWFLLAMMMAQNTFAQNNANVWTLRQCVDYAMQNSLNVQRNTYNVENAEIDKSQAWMAMAPTLNAGSSFGYNWGRSINPVTNQFTTREISSLSPNASSGVTVFNGMRIQNNIKASTKNLAASEAELEKAKNDVILDIINRYLTVVFNKELVENAKFQLASSQQQLDRTKKQVAAGSLPISNELNLESQVATNELNLINRENALALSLLQLKQAMQIPASQELDIEIPALEPEDLILENSRDQIYEMARQSLPEVKGAKLRVEGSYYAVKAAKGNLYPRLTLSGSINSNYSSANDEPQPIISDGFDVIPTENPIGFVDGSNSPVFGYDARFRSFTSGYGYREQLKDNIFRQAGLNLTIPLFNGFQARANIRRQVINQRVAEITLKQTENTVRQNVETAYNDAFAAAKTYTSTEKQVKAREEAFRMTKQRFEIGAANFVEYQVAENDLFQSKSDLSRSKYDFIFKKRLLDFYQGKPILD